MSKNNIQLEKKESNTSKPQAKHTWVSMPWQAEVIESFLPKANSSMINLTDLSMGKIEASPAFSRLQPYQSDLTSSKRISWYKQNFW